MRPSGAPSRPGPRLTRLRFWDPGGLRYPARMLDHVSLHVQDLPRALAFYRGALAPIGCAVAREFPNAAGLGESGKLDRWIAATDKPVRPLHIAFRSSRQQVDAFHGAALPAGGDGKEAPG